MLSEVACNSQHDTQFPLWRHRRYSVFVISDSHPPAGCHSFLSAKPQSLRCHTSVTQRWRRCGDPHHARLVHTGRATETLSQQYMKIAVEGCARGACLGQEVWRRRQQDFWRRECRGAARESVPKRVRGCNPGFPSTCCVEMEITLSYIQRF